MQNAFAIARNDCLRALRAELLVINFSLPCSTTFVIVRSEAIFQQGAGRLAGARGSDGAVPLLGGRRSATADLVAKGRREHAGRTVSVACLSSARSVRGRSGDGNKR